MFEGFETRDVETSETRIRLRIGGSGPPLLLLHGYPQSHAMWHRVAPVLAERFRVVCPDLRGTATAASRPPTRSMPPKASAAARATWSR
jgi:haloacetate dehalogenase